jgi:hypothetical protein
MNRRDVEGSGRWDCPGRAKENYEKPQEYVGFEILTAEVKTLLSSGISRREVR